MNTNHLDLAPAQHPVGRPSRCPSCGWDLYAVKDSKSLASHWRHRPGFPAECDKGVYTYSWERIMIDFYRQSGWNVNTMVRGHSISAVRGSSFRMMIGSYDDIQHAVDAWNDMQRLGLDGMVILDGIRLGQEGKPVLSSSRHRTGVLQPEVERRIASEAIPLGAYRVHRGWSLSLSQTSPLGDIVYSAHVNRGNSWVAESFNQYLDKLPASLRAAYRLVAPPDALTAAARTGGATAKYARK